jgi:Dolichyl-phosphate-mannose-protein mannosyltransferase
MRRERFFRNLEDWLSSQVTAGRTILATALVIGIVLRFRRLELVSMNLDEGFTWAAAAQPVGRLLQLQPMLDSGKLALYDLLLHCWIQIFGDSLHSMRGFSAATDVISVILMFAVVRELYQVFAEEELRTGELAGGFAALLFATNIAIVQSARTARMYPLMIAAELAQILFFVRAQRRGRVSDCVLTAVFLALAIAANFTAAFVMVSEAFWLAYLLRARSNGSSGSRLYLAGPALSLIAGPGLLLPWRRAATSLLKEGMRNRDYGWIPYHPPVYWSYQVLRAAAGSRWLFALLIALAGFAIWRQRSKAPLPPVFMAATTVGPFAAVAAASLVGVPMMVDRYVLIAVVGFLGLAAMGAASFKSRLGQMMVFAVIIWSAGAAQPSGVDWRQAVTMVCAASPAGSQIGVVPVYALDVVRYHLPLERRSSAIGLRTPCGKPRVLIMSFGTELTPQLLSAWKTCYPRLLGRAIGVEVRSR